MSYFDGLYDGIRTTYKTPYFYSVTESVAPTTEPVTIKTVKEYLNIAHDAENDTLILLIVAARRVVENMIRKSIINRTLLAKFQGMERSYPLPMGPVNSITSVKSVVDGVETVLTDGTGYNSYGYEYDKTIKVTNYSTATTGNAIPEVHVVYTAGMGATASAVPSNVRLAILEQIKFMYESKDEFDRISSQSSSNAKEMILPSIAPRIREYLSEYLEFTF